MNNKRYWLTPPELMKRLEMEYGPFDYDPCPYPRPEGFNSLIVPWRRNNFVNPPFRKADSHDGKTGPTAFAHKAIAEHKNGRGSVLVLPVQSYVAHLAGAGAQIVPLGSVRWLEAETGEPYPQPTTICAFILRPTE